MAMIIKKKAAQVPVEVSQPEVNTPSVEGPPNVPLTLSKNGAVPKQPAPAPVAIEDAPVTYAKTGEGEVEKKYPDGSVVVSHTPTPVVVSKNPLASVQVSMSMTRNLGNYESFKATVSITLPCEMDADSIDGTFDEARSWVDTRLEFINQEITNELAK